MCCGDGVSRARWRVGNVPDAVVEVAGYPLADEIARLVGFDKGLVGVHVGDVVESIAVDCGEGQGRSGTRGDAHPFAFCGRL